MKENRPTIALLMDHFLGDYQTVVRDAVEMTAKERGVDFLCIIGRPIDSPNNYERVQNAVFSDVSSQSVSGVIVLGANLSLYAGKERIAGFCRGLSPLPVCNIGLALDGVPSVVTDNRRIGDAVRHLAVEHGCRKFAYIGGPSANEEAMIRKAAFVDALSELGLPFDPVLEGKGEFTLSTGCEAAAKILASRRPFDALVVANDTMAIGALTVLKKNGIAVPEAVRVIGFDDTPCARFHSPRLSSMRQPSEEMSRCAVDLLLRQIRGETVPPLLELVPKLVCRQSCGCTHGKREDFRKEGLLSLGSAPTDEILRDQRDAFEKLLLKNVQIPEQAFSSWAKRVIEAVAMEVDGQTGRFIEVLEDILKTAEYRLWLIDELQSAVSVLREQLHDVERGPQVDLGSVWHEARVLLSDAAAYGQMKNQVAADLTSALFLRRAAADLPSTLTEGALVKAISGELETIGIENGLVSVFPPSTRDELECIVAIREGSPVPLKRTRYNARTFIPAFLERDERTSYVVIPLSSGDDRLGVMVLEVGAADLYYEILREHMSSYLKSIAIFKGKVEELRAEADKQRRELEMQHRQKLESLGVLAGGIAHDFNNMLSAMVGNLDVALFDLEEGTLRPEPILECKAVVKHASGLCRQLLAYSGKGQFLIKRVNLNRIINDLKDLLNVSISKSVELVFELEDRLPDIEGDVAQINQVFVNLVINASEAIEPKSGRITVSTVSRFCDRVYFVDNIAGTKPASGNYVVAVVTDTGTGINQTRLRQIFDPFYTTKFTGRGLGLAAVLGIVRGHRGAIRVESQEGEGTRFEILFPHLPRLSIVPKRTSTPPPWVGRGTVLIVDDEPTVLRAGARLLKRLGFSVVTASDGQQGIDIFQDLHEGITCVVLDITMPGIGGKAAMAEMRRVNADIPIILTSGFSEEQAFDSLDYEAPDAFLKKPYDYNTLSSTLQRALDKELSRPDSSP